MLILYIFIVNRAYNNIIMKQILFISILLFSISAFSQNTKVVFNNSPVNTSNFDGEHIAYYDAQADKETTKENVRVYEKFHANGEVAEKGYIVNNKPDGVWKRFDTEGRLVGKTKYKDGLKRGKWIVWNNDGSIIAKGRYNADGNKTGNWIYWSSVDMEYLEKSF